MTACGRIPHRESSWRRRNAQPRPARRPGIAFPALAGGKPGFVYSAAAASWVSSRGWDPVRFFCVMGRTAAAMAVVSEGGDLKSRPADMPAVSEKECALVRRHLGELLRAASGAAAPKPR